MTDFRFDGTITALSPIAHNSDESCGTDTKFRRMKIFYNEQDYQIPFYSGNAFRGILRRIAARQFVDAIGLVEMSDKLYYTFFTGGSLQKGAAQNYIEIGKKRDLRENIPFLSIFGTALGNQIIAGKLKVDCAFPIAKETQALTGKSSSRSVYELTEEIFYTRRDDLEDKEKVEGKQQAQQMKYNIEVLAAGVELSHGFSLECVNNIEAGCFVTAVKRMQEKGIIGGKSSAGHGKVKMEYCPEWPDENYYLDYVKENKTKIIEFVKKLEASL